MKNIYLTAAVMAFVLLSGSAAFAFSTETNSGVKGSGGAQFADPDEQTPPGLMVADPNGTNNSVGMTEPSVTAPSIQQQMGVNQGEQSFDNAYNHLQNQK